MLIDSISRGDIFKARTAFNTVRTDVKKGDTAPVQAVHEAGVVLRVDGTDVWFAAPAFRKLWVKA